MRARRWHRYFFGGGIQRVHPSVVVSNFGIRPVKTIRLGTTTKTQEEASEFLRSIAHKYTPSTCASHGALRIAPAPPPPHPRPPPRADDLYALERPRQPSLPALHPVGGDPPRRALALTRHPFPRSLTNNCNNFSDEFARFLCGNGVPEGACPLALLRQWASRRWGLTPR